jgi:hypothetical protein
MLLLKTIGLLFSISAFSVTNPSDLWPKSAKLNTEIGNFSVKIETDSFKKIMKSKEDLIAKYFWSKERDHFICVINSVCSILMSKIRILSGIPFNKFIKKYKLVEKINGWHKYRDKTGTEDYSDISLKYEKDILSLIQKKPTGTEYINFSFENDKYGKVLKSVEHKSFVGLQKFKTITTIEYGDNLKLRLPKKIKMITNQSLITNDTKTTKRKIAETYQFTDYIINNKSNLEQLKLSK